MTITISIENKIISLVLKNGKKIIDQVEFQEDRDLAQQLLPEIDNLLRQHSLGAADIKKVSVKTSLGESFTSRRIAEAVANTFNWQFPK